MRLLEVVCVFVTSFALTTVIEFLSYDGDGDPPFFSSAVGNVIVLFVCSLIKAIARQYAGGYNAIQGMDVSTLFWGTSRAGRMVMGGRGSCACAHCSLIVSHAMCVRVPGCVSFTQHWSRQCT
jgi:hypothetical protein